MKLSIFALLTMGFVMGAGAADQAVPKKVKPDPAPAAAKVQVIAIPAGAVEVEPYIYRYTDPKGKNWIYRKTPFGVVRIEDKPVSADKAQAAKDQKEQLIETTKALEVGNDTIQFERVWPFGRTQWQRKKTDLNEVERAVWARELQKREARESASKD